MFVVALIYSNEHPHFHWIMRAALPALLVEVMFYLASVFDETRVWFGQIEKRPFEAALLWASALTPYLIFSFATATFALNAFVLLAILCGILAFWHVLFPRRPAFDGGFLVVAAAPVLLHVFPRIYRSPDGHTRTDALGHLMWIRLGIAALLILRGWHPGAFGFWPRAAEWRVGLVYYFIILIPIVLLGLELRAVSFAPPHGAWCRIAGLLVAYFFGALWVVALGEELFFRGVIEKALLEKWRAPFMAVLISAIVFAALHLWFRRFPNWRHAILAGILGIGCGLAYARTGSVRASMVTHACVVTTWRMLFAA